jgi:hypothetical protein
MAIPVPLSLQGLAASAIDKMLQRASLLQTRACQQKIRNIPGRSAVLVTLLPKG